MGKLNVYQNDHEQTTITHFSHVHPLHITILNHNQSQTPNTIPSCSACKHAIFGTVYSCHFCNFVLHFKCSQMPQHIKHPFDDNNNHVFSLLPVSLYPGGYFKCDACGKQGNGFSYNCDICTIDLHVHCASMPLKSSHHSHHHELRLSFFSPYQNNAFSCDICKNPGSNSWLYRCDYCEFDVHLDCVSAKLPVNHIWPNQIYHPNKTITHPPRPLPPSSSQNLRDKVISSFLKEASETAGEQCMLNVLSSTGFGNGGASVGGGMFQALIGGATGGESGDIGLDVLMGNGGMDPNSVFGGRMNVDVVGSGEI